jgi:aldehyde dehydrogenase (NAD+)
MAPIVRAPRDLELKIGGDFEPGHDEPITVSNPANGRSIAEVRAASTEQVQRAVGAAHQSFRHGELGTAEERSAALHRLADVFESRSDAILERIIEEVGTPISTAPGLHVHTPVRILRWLAEATLTDRTEHLPIQPGPPANAAKVVYKPVGPVASIAAYNYPLMFAAMKMGSAFAAGCPTVLLSSPHSPLSILEFGRLAEEADLPENALSTLVGGVATAQALIGSPDIAKVSFTGSVQAGTAVMKGAADGLRGVVLELGGKSAAIVLPTADMDQVVPAIHSRYLRNAGQGCASPTRILVSAGRYEEFVAASREYFSRVVVGDPTDPATLVGPVISEQHRDRVNGYIDEAVDIGGTIVAQGMLPELDHGWWVRPTLIGGLPNSARVNQEEIFGPVATLQAYSNLDEAVDVANDSDFGLHTSIFGPTEDALSLAERFDVGLVTINGGGPTRTDAPNGGWKTSGIGRERGEHGIREFLEPVTIQWPLHG